MMSASGSGPVHDEAMPAPLLIDLTHTSHTRARTGIQRVTRSLHAALGDSAIAITHDPHWGTWRELEPWERSNLGIKPAATKRGSRWPLSARVRSRARRVLGTARPALPPNSGLIVPEVFSSVVASAWSGLFDAVQGPRIALFHDAIALKFPELTPPKTVARFPAYLVELLAFDGIAAVSQDSHDALVDYWRWLGAKNPPPVEVIPLGVDTQGWKSAGENSPANRPASTAAKILCVGSIEGRKNHAELLAACEQLWSRGEKFSLRLIGLPQPETGSAALAQIRELQAAGRPLRYDGPVDDATLAAAYAECDFTVYPSVAEGFGLPVIESLAHGKPCVCSARGALGESARGGGCVMLEAVDAATLADALCQLVATPARVAALAAEARARRFRTWNDYAADLTKWLPALDRR